VRVDWADLREIGLPSPQTVVAQRAALFATRYARTRSADVKRWHLVVVAAGATILVVHSKTAGAKAEVSDDGTELLSLALPSGSYSL
jgi:predicted nicotinamide N-methyase